MAVKIDGSKAIVLWLTNDHHKGTLTKNHGILYVNGTANGERKLGERNDKDLSGLTPINAYEDRYLSQQSSLFEDLHASLIVVYDKTSTNVKVKVDDNVRKFIHDLYLKGLIPFDGLFPGHQEQGNRELLLGYTDHIHMDILIDVIKQFFNVKHSFNTIKPVVLREIQEPVVNEVVDILLNKKVALLAAYASFGKTITALQIISKVLPNGGIALFTTPIVDTLQSLINNVGTYHFGDNRNTSITFLNEADYAKTSIKTLQKRKKNGEIILIGLSVQDLRYQDEISDQDSIRVKYANLTNNLDLWVCDERHFQYEGVYTNKKLSNISATYTLDLTATPYDVLDKYDPSQIVSRTLAWGMINRDISDLPKLVLESFDTPFSNVVSNVADMFSEEEGFSPIKLFALKNNNFVYKSELLKICDLMYYNSLSKKKNPLSIVNDVDLSDVSKNCGLWLLPMGSENVSSSEYIPTLAYVLNNSQSHTFFISSYDLEGMAKNASFKSISHVVDSLLQTHKRIIILTCRKFTTGTDIPALGHIVMFDKMESVSAFEQLLGRTIRLYPNKDVVKVYSLAPGYSIKTTLGKIALYNETLGRGSGLELLESVSLSSYDLENAKSTHDPIDILENARIWCENQINNNKLPSGQLENVVDSFVKSEWADLNLITHKPVTNTSVDLSNDNGAKNKETPTNKPKYNKDSLEAKIMDSIQAIFVEATWVAYMLKSYDYNVVLNSDSLINFFGKDLLDAVTTTADNNEKFRTMLNKNMLDKKLAFELLDIDKVLDKIFINNEMKANKGLVFINADLSNRLLDELDDIEPPKSILIFNALNGCLPIQVQKKYPNASIVCAEVFDLFKDSLTIQGFTVIDYKDVINMINTNNIPKFDVIIQNPPYQKNDNGHGSSATAIYQDFVDIAIELKPSHIVSVIPSRWMTGGKGARLNNFRKRMAQANSFKVLHDFHNSCHFFPTVVIKGGVCYFRWDLNFNGDCKVIEHYIDGTSSETYRPLFLPNMATVIRYNEAIDILNKVQSHNEPSIVSNMPVRNMFPFETDFLGDTTPTADPVTFYGQKVVSTVDRSTITKNIYFVYSHKVIVTEAVGNGTGVGDKINPIYAGPNTCFSKTYIPLAEFNTEKECRNYMSYINTKFFHFLLTLKKYTQHTSQKEYSLIPVQDFTKAWTDEELFEKYDISEDEINFITRMVK